jgi:uncharacterized protein YbcC (UPF0753/DUF2309 family)
VPDTAAPSHPPTLSHSGDAAREELEHLIEHAAHLLPSQGPLSVFVHHNTLHAFEHLNFTDAVEQASHVYGCQPYLNEARYRHELARGRIRVDDLIAVLQDDLGERADELIGLLGTRFYLRQAMLQAPLYTAPTVELKWIVAETEALRRYRSDASPEFRERMIDGTKRWIMRDFRNGGAMAQQPEGAAALRPMIADLLESGGKDQIEFWSYANWEAFSLQLLWRICCHGAALSDAPPHSSKRFRRHRDVLFDAVGQDSDALVHEILIRYTASFLDQGVGHWPLPDRDRGFYVSFLQLFGAPGGLLPHWLGDLHRELQRLAREKVSPCETIEESLAVLGVAADEREAYIQSSLIALSGWAGMVWQMETNAEWTVHPAPRGSLVEFLAVRLLLDRFAVAHIAREYLQFRGALQEVRAAAAQTPAASSADLVVQRAFLVFQLAQALGWKPEELNRLTPGSWLRLIEEIEAFNGVERRRIFHLAYERCYLNQTLDAIANYALRPNPAPPLTASGVPLFQIVACLDEREESFRRHLEEVEPRCETFGAAGFFGVAMYYRGAAEANSRPLCPVVIKPQHFVEELPSYSFTSTHLWRARTRKIIGTASHHVHRGSRSLFGGALTALVGSLASIPMVARILFPRMSAQIRRIAGSIVRPPQMTRLLLERREPDPGPTEGHIGYTVDEMAGIVERLLRDIGLTANFARLVIVCGHGSSSLNNPHTSAYDCGACGGGRGGPNGRAFAHMANDPRIRDIINRRGLTIPTDTVFVGAMHNTCNDSMVYYDLDALPATHTALLEQAKAEIDEACQRNAQERCRRFESAPLSLTPEAALRHVEERSEDLAQVRPECGHATNAVCFVGRRQRVRGMFLDRRTFLTSYDPTHDADEYAILTRILGAVIPVCAGINLEYYFSYTDSPVLGCGTKLPHNITSLLGVMDGASSDLRPGLPWQMVEIHEPVRITFVIENTPAAMLQILDRNPPLATLCRNAWIQLAVLDPHSAQIHLFHRGEFHAYETESDQLPEVVTSADWYRGWRDHLGYARVTGGGR